MIILSAVIPLFEEITSELSNTLLSRILHYLLLDGGCSPKSLPDIDVNINVRELVIGTARDKSEMKSTHIVYQCHSGVS